MGEFRLVDNPFPSVHAARFASASTVEARTIMNIALRRWHLCLAILCGLIYRRQQHIIESYQSQLESLLEIQGKRAHFILRRPAATVGRQRQVARVQCPSEIGHDRDTRRDSPLAPRTRRKEAGEREAPAHWQTTNPPG